MSPPLLALVSLALGLGCGTEEQDQLDLVQASTTTTFATAEQLGPHRTLTSSRRTEQRAGGAAQTFDEVVEIAWGDWDNFQIRRLADGEAVRETRVVDGKVWVRSGDTWSRRDDVEPHRMQLRTTWDNWDEALGPLRNHVRMVPDGSDIVEGRPAARFRLELIPDAEAPRVRSSAWQPTSIQGTVWLDEGTALHLKAEFTSVAERKGVTRTLAYTQQRAGFGEDPGITAPEGG